MLRRVVRALRETPLSLALLLLVALMLLPGPTVTAGHSGAALPHAAPVAISTKASSHGQAIPAVYGTTSVTTSDSKVANNLAMNFSMTFATAISLSAGQDVNVTLEELVALNVASRSVTTASIGFWAHYDVGTSSTVVWPEATIGNGTVTNTIVDTAISLTTPGTLEFRMSYLHGYWWTFMTNGGQLIGSGVPAWQNGTYLLNASSALGYYSFGGRFSFAPTVFMNESGPSLPFTSSQFEGVLSPAMQFNTTVSGYQPSNGLYQAPGTASYAIPMAGYDQCFTTGCPWKLGNDTVLVNWPTPVPSVTANGATLWGVPPPPPVSFHTWLGAETVDPSFMNVTGEQLTIDSVPSVIPPGGLFATHEAVLPVNGTDEMYIGFVDANVTFGTLAFQGVFAFYALSTYNSGSFGIDLTPLAAGTSHTLTVQHAAGWWWTLKLDGSTVSWCTGITSCTGNSTILLNATTAWGETNTTFTAGPGGRIGAAGFFVPIPYSTQPMLAYFGNMTTYSVMTSIELDSRSGVWGTPYMGNAWSWDIKNSKDVLIGNTQEPWAVPVGSVLVENATAAFPSPLSNTTTGGAQNPVWIGTAVSAIATPTTVASGGGSTSIVVSVTSGGGAVSNAVVNVSDTDPQQYGHCSPFFQPTGTAGSYSGTCWFNATMPTTLTANLLVTATPASGAVGTSAMQITLTPPLTVAALLVGTPSGSTVQAGAALTLEVWTNVSGIGGVANAWPLVSFQQSGVGIIGANSSSATGVYSLPVTISQSPTGTSATLTIAAAGGAGAGYNVATAPSILLTINLPKATVSPVWISGSGASSIAAGATVTFSVNVSGSSGALTGAYVHFGVTCNGGNNCTSSFTTVTAPSPTNGQGASSWTVTVPASLTQATTYTVTATTKPSGYASASATALPVTVEVPSSNNNNNNNSNNAGASPLLLYGIIGVVVVAAVAALALMMMRKKKKPAAASAAPASSQGGMESWSPSPEGAGGAPGAEPPAEPAGQA